MRTSYKIFKDSEDPDPTADLDLHCFIRNFCPNLKYKIFTALVKNKDYRNTSISIMNTDKLHIFQIQNQTASILISAKPRFFPDYLRDMSNKMFLIVLMHK